GVEGLRLVNRATGASRAIVACDSPATCRGAVSNDGRVVFCCTDRDRDLTAFARVRIDDLGSAAPMTYIASRDDAELASFALNRGCTDAALVWNVEGRSEMELIELATLKRRAVPLPDEIVADVSFSNGGERLVAVVSGPQAPSAVWILQIATGE